MYRRYRMQTGCQRISSCQRRIWRAAMPNPRSSACARRCSLGRRPNAARNARLAELSLTKSTAKASVENACCSVGSVNAARIRSSSRASEWTWHDNRDRARRRERYRSDAKSRWSIVAEIAKTDDRVMLIEDTCELQSAHCSSWTLDENRCLLNRSLFQAIARLSLLILIRLTS